MTKLPLYIAVLFALIAGNVRAQTYSTENPKWPAEPWRSATPVELGRELPRTQTICYAGEEAALGQSREASTYLQPLGENWKTSANGESVSYEHSFKMPFTWVDRDLYLYIGSANAPYEVFVNGQRVGYNQSSWTAAEFNITRSSKEGINMVEIKLHGDAAATVLEERPAVFKLQLGEEVYILAQPRVRVRDYVNRTHIESGNAMMELGVIIKSDMLNPKALTVHYSLLSPGGEVVTSGRRDREIDMRREDTVRFVINVPGAKLWSPDEPNLYTLLVKTQHEGRYWEYIAYKIGIRTVEIDTPKRPTGGETKNPTEKGTLLINGRSFPFNFADNYTLSDYSLKAKNAVVVAISEMKSMNINIIKAYKPLPGWFYSLCDEMGMFVIGQADINTKKSGESRKIGGNQANDTIWKESYMDRAKAVIYASKHHPSVIGFSLGAGVSNGYNLYESYINAKSILAETGDGRPVIYVAAGGEWNTDAIAPEVASSKSGTPAGRIVLTRSQPKPATFEVKDPVKGLFSVSSGLHFRSTTAKVAYTVRQGKRRVSRGTINVELIPGSETLISIPYGKAKVGRGALTVDLNTTIPSWQGVGSPKTTGNIIEVAFP